MNAVVGQDIAKVFLDALGLGDMKVRTLTLRIAMNEAVTITVEQMEFLDVPEGGEGLVKAAVTLTEYNLIEVKDESDDGT